MITFFLCDVCFLSAQTLPHLPRQPFLCHPILHHAWAPSVVIVTVCGQVRNKHRDTSLTRALLLNFCICYGLKTLKLIPFFLFTRGRFDLTSLVGFSSFLSVSLDGEALDIRVWKSQQMRHWGHWGEGNPDAGYLAAPGQASGDEGEKELGHLSLKYVNNTKTCLT